MGTNILPCHSLAATSVRYGKMCNDHFVANFVLSLAVDSFENRLTFRKVIDASRVSCFSIHSVVGQVPIG